jgi:gluconolactonase
MSTILTPAAASDFGFVAYGSAFEAVLGDAPRLEPVLEIEAHEGPVYVPGEHALYLTTVPRRSDPESPDVAIVRVGLGEEDVPLGPDSVTVVRASANVANGMTLDRSGRLVVCEQGTMDEPARISRFELVTGLWETLVEDPNRMPLNSPNDVVVKSDGTVWFTDPSYGHLQGFRPPPSRPDAVYRYDPASRRLDAVAEVFDKPNGLAFSPDERLLYVGDNGAPHHLLAFGVRDVGTLTRARILARSTREHPDGLKVDSDGRIYASAATGIRVYTPAGELIGEIQLPGAVNFTFGGRNGNVLYITADTAVWAATLAARGADGRDRERS